MTIHELAKLNGNCTDKQNNSHSFDGSNYLHHYEAHFESMRQSPIKLLEIGVLSGHSLNLWRDYFQNGEIHGLDIDPSCSIHASERIQIHIGSQIDEAVLGRITSDHGPFDIIIDDGSHMPKHILRTFKTLFKSVKPGGFYVMEDMRISYEGVSVVWPGMKHNKDWDEGDRADIDKFLQSELRSMDYFDGGIRGIHLYSMIYFLQKAATK